MTSPKVAVVMGSGSDLPVMEKTAKKLADLEISFEVKVLSAHRTPDATREYARSAADRGIAVIIAGAGGSAALAGTIAAQTNLPVVGVPLDATSLGGRDALFATVQMPPGFPVAAVAIGEWGAVNAAILAARILAVTDDALRSRLEQMKSKMAEKTEAACRDAEARFS